MQSLHIPLCNQRSVTALAAFVPSMRTGSRSRRTPINHSLAANARTLQLQHQQQQQQLQRWNDVHAGKSSADRALPTSLEAPGGVQGHGSPQGSYLEQLLKGLRISHEQAAGLLLSCPGLLELEPRRAGALIHGLSKFLGCTHRRSCAILAKQPRVLHTPPAALQQQLRLLQLGLQLDSKALGEVVLRQPGLLFDPPQEVRVRVEQVAAELGVPVPRLLRAATKEPWVLVASPTSLPPKLAMLASVWALERPQLVALVLQHPQLLTMSLESISAKLSSVGQALNLTRGRAAALVLAYPGMLKFSHTKLAAQVDALRQLLPLEDRQVRAIAFQEPSLLARSPASPEASFRTLQQLLSCSKAQAANLVARRPSLLTTSPKSLRRMFAALSVWRFSLDTKRQLLHSHPLLFRLSPHEVHGRCRWLRSLMMGNPYFHSTLRNLPLPLLGVLLLHLPTAWSRLLYLAESSQEGTIDVMRATQCKASTFDAAFPEYSKWRSFRFPVMHSVGHRPPWRVANSGLERSPPVPPKRGRRRAARGMPPALTGTLGLACTPGLPGTPLGATPSSHPGSWQGTPHAQQAPHPFLQPLRQLGSAAPSPPGPAVPRPLPASTHSSQPAAGHPPPWYPPLQQPPLSSSGSPQQGASPPSHWDGSPMQHDGQQQPQPQLQEDLQTGEGGLGELVEVHEGATMRLGSKLTPGLVLQKPKRIVHRHQLAQPDLGSKQQQQQQQQQLHWSEWASHLPQQEHTLWHQQQQQWQQQWQLQHAHQQQPDALAKAPAEPTPPSIPQHENSS